ncbi:MAG: ABC transporter substrate-binding protein [Christensenellales bacterium]
MNKPVKLVSMILIVMMFLGLITGCATSTPAGTATQKPAVTNAVESSAKPTTTEWDGKFTGEIVFGVALSMTGSEALVSTRGLDAIKYRVNQINKDGGVLDHKELKYQIEDDQSGPDGAVPAVAKLLENKNLVCIMGPCLSSSMYAVEESIEKAGRIALINGTNPYYPRTNNPYLYCVRSSDLLTCGCAIKFMVEKYSPKKVGIIHDNDEHGTGARDIIVKYLNAKGIAYEDQGHNVGDKDFTGQLLAFKSAGCDAIMSWSHPTETVIALRQRYELSMNNIPTMCSSALSDKTTYSLLDIPMYKGCYSTADISADNKDPMVQELMKESNATYGYDATTHYVIFDTSIKLLVDAIERAGTTETKALMKALDETKNFYTGFGYLTAPKDRTVSYSMVHQVTVVTFDDTGSSKVVELVYEDGYEPPKS